MIFLIIFYQKKDIEKNDNIMRLFKTIFIDASDLRCRQHSIFGTEHTVLQAEVNSVAYHEKSCLDGSFFYNSWSQKWHFRAPSSLR